MLGTCPTGPAGQPTCPAPCPFCLLCRETGGFDEPCPRSHNLEVGIVVGLPLFRRFGAAALVTTVAASLLITGHTPARADGGPLRVYVITIDGLKPSEVGVLTPNISALRGSGTWYDQARAVFPAETLPNHVAMATGVLPEDNGIIGNQFYVPNTIVSEKKNRHYM